MTRFKTMCCVAICVGLLMAGSAADGAEARADRTDWWIPQDWEHSMLRSPSIQMAGHVLGFWNQGRLQRALAETTPSGSFWLVGECR